MEHLLDTHNDYSTLQLFSKIGLEQPIKDIISKLIFISKINVGEKLNVRDYFVRDNNSISQRLIRTIKNFFSQDTGEYKEDSLKFLENTISEALELIFIYYPKSKDNEKEDFNSDTNSERMFPSSSGGAIKLDFNRSIALLLIKNVKDCKIGIENLKQTYSYDRNFVSDLQALLQTLDIKLTSIIKN